MPTDDLQLLHIDLATCFVMTDSGRLERQNDPDHSPAPRLSFIGCPAGNLVRVRHDLEDDVAQRLFAIGGQEPPWRDPWTLPGCIGKLLDVLSTGQQITTVAPGVIYQLPNRMKYEHSATIVEGDSEAGREMVARFAAHGMPQAMIDAGFKSVADLWEPWCIAIEGEEVAATAFPARLGTDGAEIGVYTFPAFRSRGYAAAMTASWSSLPSLEGRALFYSTWRSNRSSQRVAARLGLRMIGASVNIGY